MHIDFSTLVTALYTEYEPPIILLYNAHMVESKTANLQFHTPLQGGDLNTKTIIQTFKLF